MINKKILVIGVGSIGKRHAKCFEKLNYEIDIVDISKKRIMEAKGKIKVVDSFIDYRQALSTKKYSGVLVCTPPHLHLEMSSQVIKKNCNLFIEKPLGMNTNGWAKLFDECKKKKIVNYVAFCHRHINYIRKSKKIILDGKIGKILTGNIIWGSYLPDWHPWEKYYNFYMAKKNEGGGALMDESHGIDLLRFLAGEVEDVHARVLNVSSLKITSDDLTVMNCRLKNKSVFQLNFDLISRVPRVSIEIIGTKGSLIIDRVLNQIKLYSSRKKKWSILQFSQNDLLRMYDDQAKYFIDCINKKHKNHQDIADGIKTQKIIDKAFESSKKKKIMNVN